MMSEQEKKIGERLAKAWEKLPDAKRERLLGFAEGVEAMAAKQDAEKQAQENPSA